MRIVITGASGNVGSALLRRLGRGRRARPRRRRAPPAGRGPRRSPAWSGRRSTCPATTARARCARPAPARTRWCTSPGGSSRPIAWTTSPSSGSAARGASSRRSTAAGVPHLVHMSSVGAYSPRRDDSPVAETWPTGACRARRTAGTRPPRSGCSTGSRATPPARPSPGSGPGSWASATPVAPCSATPCRRWCRRRLLDHVPVLPLDRRLAIPMVHADDVADAIVRVLEGRVPGPSTSRPTPPSPPTTSRACWGPGWCTSPPRSCGRRCP